MDIPYNSRVKRQKLTHNREHFDGNIMAEVQFKNLLQKNFNPLVYQKLRNKRQKHLMKKLRIRNTNEIVNPIENKLTNAPIQMNEKETQSRQNVNGYCSSSGLPTSDVNMKVYNHETK